MYPVCVGYSVLSPFTLGIRTTTADAELVLQPVSGLVSGLLLGLPLCAVLFSFLGSHPTAQPFVSCRPPTPHLSLSASHLLLVARPYCCIDIGLESCENRV